MFNISFHEAHFHLRKDEKHQVTSALNWLVYSGTCAFLFLFYGVTLNKPFFYICLAACLPFSKI